MKKYKMKTQTITTTCDEWTVEAKNLTDAKKFVREYGWELEGRVTHHQESDLDSEKIEIIDWCEIEEDMDEHTKIYN